MRTNSRYYYLRNYRKLSLAGVGVRVKQIGPIKAKVYSAAVYLDKGCVQQQCKTLKCDTEKDLMKSSEFETTVNCIVFKR